MDLKSCQFCGCNAGVLEREQLNGPILYKIVCNSKKCRGHDHAGNVGAWMENGWRESREEAAELWNRRSERTCELDQFRDVTKTVDRDALLALADEMDRVRNRCDFCGKERDCDWADETICLEDRIDDYASIIREACGENAR